MILKARTVPASSGTEDPTFSGMDGVHLEPESLSTWIPSSLGCAPRPLFSTSDLRYSETSSKVVGHVPPARSVPVERLAEMQASLIPRHSGGLKCSGYGEFSGFQLNTLKISPLSVTMSLGQLVTPSEGNLLSGAYAVFFN